MASLLSLQKDFKKIQKAKPSNFTYARTCYNHLAGEIGVKITNALIAKHIIIPENDVYTVSEFGRTWFLELGIDIHQLQQLKRSFAHQCLDWSERKHHLAGALGDAFLNFMLKEDWFRKQKNSRELILTYKGTQHLNRLLDLNF